MPHGRPDSLRTRLLRLLPFGPVHMSTSTLEGIDAGRIAGNAAAYWNPVDVRLARNELKRRRAKQAHQATTGKPPVPERHRKPKPLPRRPRIRVQRKIK